MIGRFAGCFLALLWVPPALAAVPDPAAVAFERMKSLVGTWHNAADPASPLRIRFYSTAGGTVLVEEWQKAGAPHSLTVYHRDGPALLATHYCPQGNQPRLELVASTAPVLRFAFRDATDLDPAGESHQHALAFDLTDPNRPVRSETYRSSNGDELSRLMLERD
jgi:hypothetical protein